MCRANVDQFQGKKNKSFDSTFEATTLLGKIAIGLLIILTMASSAQAGVAFKKVWFPDGIVRFNWNESPAPADSGGNLLTTNQDAAFGFIRDHTPVRVVPNATNPNLKLRWSGGGWAVTRGYWQPSGSALYGKTLAFARNKSEGSSPSEPRVRTIVHEFGHALGFAHEFQRLDFFDHVTIDWYRILFGGAAVSFGVTVDPWNYWPVNNPFFAAWGARNLSPFDYASNMNACYIVDANDQTCSFRDADGDGVNDGQVIFDTVPADPVRHYKLFNYQFNTRQTSNRFNLMSVHEINSVYRVYARALGKNEEGDEFGHAVATGDFDNDGHEDIAVALNEEGLNSDHQLLMVYLFRGVSLDVAPGEDAVDLHHVPWLKYVLDDTGDPDRNVVLAAGDFNGDEIGDLAVGDPSHGADSGRVFMVFFNQAWSGEAGACDSGARGANGGDACAPWGERSVLGHHVILPEDVGLSAGDAHRFGASLASADVTKRRAGTDDRKQMRAKDLLIGAPGAFEANVFAFEQGFDVYADTSTSSFEADMAAANNPYSDSKASTFDDWGVVETREAMVDDGDVVAGPLDEMAEEGGAVILVRPDIMARLQDTPESTSLNWSVFDSEIVWNPGSADAEFGASVGRIPAFCDQAFNGLSVPLDGFVVGAPGEAESAGAVYYYNCAVDNVGQWVTPLTETGSRMHATAPHRYGAAVEAFSVAEMDPVGCGVDYYVVSSAPRHNAAGSRVESGRVYVHRVDNAGNMIQETTLRPVSTVSGGDRFGAALAVHQRASKTCTNEAGNPIGGGHVEVAVGMPGNAIDGNADVGRVYVWNPWNKDGSINYSAAIETPAPFAPGTRAGHSIATIRNLTAGGGFAVGVPGGVNDWKFDSRWILQPIQSGIVWTLLNQDFSENFGWSSYERVLSQKTAGDLPPDNLTPKCGLGFEAGLIVPLLLLGRGVLGTRRPGSGR